MTWGGLYTAAFSLGRESSASSSTASASMVCPNSGLSSGHCHAKLALGALALVGTGAAIGYFVSRRASCRHNCDIRLGEEKVVDMIDVEDIGDKKAYCRCWKSKKFPLCDGTHGKHNKETGDNLGPVVIKKKDA